MKTLFLLGHMRSYSSVLSHILGSHPQVSGYCETHTKYRTYFDLWKLRWRVRKLTREPLRGDYVLDKVLHDYPMCRSVLNSHRTRGIILIRRPRETVRSIIEMGLTHSPVAWHRDFELVAGYYETRLAGLLRLTQALRGRVVFIEAEALMSNTRAVLDQLGAFLQLKSPLPTEYRHFAHTGEAGFGDPSKAIAAGKVTVMPRVGRTTVSLPRTLTHRLQVAHDFWCAAIRQTCPSITEEGCATHSALSHTEYNSPAHTTPRAPSAEPSRPRSASHGSPDDECARE